MRDTKSMILNGVEDKVKASPAPVVPKEDAKPAEQADVKSVEPLPASGNGYAQAATQVNTVNDAIQSKTQIDKPEVQDPAPDESEQPKIGSLTDFTNEIYRSRMPSESELNKEKKREKSRAVIAAIADGVSAISNLYFTGKGARNVEQTSMSAANTKRYQDILDRRRKMQGEWDNARLAAYDRDRVFGNQENKDRKADERYLGEWNRTGKWHDDAVSREDMVRLEEKERRDRLDKDAKDIRDREFNAQEKARKDDSARRWAVVGAQNKRAEAQEKRQREKAQYQFGKINGSPEPKKIGEKRSIYIGKNTWEQNSGQIASEIYKDLLEQDPKIAKDFSKAVNGGYGNKSADAKQTAALVDKYIMRSPRAQQLAIELEKDYKKRYQMATDGSLPDEDAYGKYQSNDDDPYAKYETN